MTTAPPSDASATAGIKPAVAAMSSSRFPKIPASFFAMVLGLSGLGYAWRAAHQVWQAPAIVGEALMGLAAIVWAVLIVLFALKWILARADATAEADHPIQCCFIGLVGVSTMLMAGAALPYSRLAAEIVFALGAFFTLCFAVWRTGHLWQGARAHEATTPVLYLPAGAGGFVMAAGASALGYPEWGQLAFGFALLSWIAIESVLLHRLYTLAPLPPALRPTLGIQLAPPTVGAVAYLSVNGGAPDIVAHALLGYGLLQALLLLRLLPWIMQQPFNASYWAFTFGAAALATAPLRLIAQGDSGPIALLAPILFVGANVAIALIAVGTLRLIAQGRLLPAAPPPSPATPARSA
jgi:tellurite resistance protein